MKLLSKRLHENIECGHGLVADDIGVCIMLPLDQCGGLEHVFMNLGNMILMPRVPAVCMTE